MAVTVTIPKLGVEMESARIDHWVRKEGEWVEEGEVLLVIETEKVTFEVEAATTGYLHIIGEAGKEYKIGELLAMITEDKEEYRGMVSQNDVPSENVETQNMSSTVSHVSQKVSPLARRIAKDTGVDVSLLKGSGPDGAIIKKDVMLLLEEVKQTDLKESENKEVEIRNLSVSKVVKETKPLSGMRKVIARKMYESLQRTAQMTDISEIEVTALVEFRNELKELSEEIGYTISYTSLMIKIVAIILKELPILNASIEDEQIVYWDNVNIGVAVALDDGLVVPVIYNADKLSLGEIHLRLDNLISKAKNKSLLPDEMSGGTFTITNFGSFGSVWGTPIINPPEVGILGVGAIQQKPVVRNGEIAIGNVMGYSLTVDHRLIDGNVAGKFQKAFKHIVQNPKLLIVK